MSCPGGRAVQRHILTPPVLFTSSFSSLIAPLTCAMTCWRGQEHQCIVHLSRTAALPPAVWKVLMGHWHIRHGFLTCIPDLARIVVFLYYLSTGCIGLREEGHSPRGGVCPRKMKRHPSQSASDLLRALVYPVCRPSRGNIAITIRL